VGQLVVKLTGAPKHQTPSILAATAFANNTALPITLLAVVHANFPSTSDLGRIDPTLFLSVYLCVQHAVSRHDVFGVSKSVLF